MARKKKVVQEQVAETLSFSPEREKSMSGTSIVGLTILTIAVVTGGIVGCAGSQSIPAGHVGVVSLFGEVRSDTLSEGYNFINPFCKVTQFDARQQTRKETANVPSEDQLTTEFDVSVQYRIDRAMAAKMMKETGTPEMAVDVHLLPNLRSILREQGKTVEHAEDFFQHDIQTRLQMSLLTELQAMVASKGIIVEAVLIREIRLPQFIIDAIHAKKVRGQLAEQQKSELDRYKTEQEQKVAAADAERRAAEQEAQKQVILAEASAKVVGLQATALANQIEVEGAALRKNPEVIKLEMIKKWSGVLPQTMLGSDVSAIIQTGGK